MNPFEGVSQYVLNVISNFVMGDNCEIKGIYIIRSQNYLIRKQQVS